MSTTTRFQAKHNIIYLIFIPLSLHRVEAIVFDGYIRVAKPNVGTPQDLGAVFEGLRVPVRLFRHAVPVGPAPAGPIEPGGLRRILSIPTAPRRPINARFTAGYGEHRERRGRKKHRNKGERSPYPFSWKHCRIHGASSQRKRMTRHGSRKSRFDSRRWSHSRRGTRTPILIRDSAGCGNGKGATMQYEHHRPIDRTAQGGAV